MHLVKQSVYTNAAVPVPLLSNDYYWYMLHKSTRHRFAFHSHSILRGLFQAQDMLHAHLDSLFAPEDSSEHDGVPSATKQQQHASESPHNSCGPAGKDSSRSSLKGKAKGSKITAEASAVNGQAGRGKATEGATPALDYLKSGGFTPFQNVGGIVLFTHGPVVTSAGCSTRQGDVKERGGAGSITGNLLEDVMVKGGKSFKSACGGQGQGQQGGKKEKRKSKRGQDTMNGPQESVGKLK